MNENEEFEFRYRLEQEQAQAGQPQEKAQPNTSGSFPEARNIINSDASVGSKLWQGLQVPSQMASRGLNAMASAVPNPEPTGNLPMDVLKGTPYIAANTLAQAAPEFINRASILTAGGAKLLQAARPVGSAVGRWVAGQAESATNAVEGSLAAAWNNPKLILSKGKKAAGPLYDAGKAELEQGASIFKNMYKPDEIIQTAQDYLGKGGKLEPAEALVYRKALDVVGRSRGVVKDSLVGMRSVADEAVKESPNMSAADAAYQKGLQAESLRRLVPQNKYGGSSAFKMAMMGFLTNALGPAGAGVLSPVVHGTIASAGGATARVATNPAAAVTVRQAYSQFIDKVTTRQ